MTTITVVLKIGATWTVPADFTAANTIRALAGGQAGTQGSALGQGIGGEGADYAEISNAALTPGDVLAIQIGAGGAIAGAAGTDTWFKNHAGAKILQARGGASISANIGTIIRPGGARVVAVASNDGTYGNVLTPGFGGTGGASSGGPDAFQDPSFNGYGSRGGDTNYAVGQVGGTGGGFPCTNGTPPWDAPGQFWLANGGDGADMGRGGGRIGPPFGFSGARGFNNPLGNLNPGGGANGFGNAGVPTWQQGGLGGQTAMFFDTVSGDFCGSGGGGGGGGGGGRNSGSGQINPGNGGAAGEGGGGGGSGGIGGPNGAQVLGAGAGTLWQAFTGALATPGIGGAGWIVIEYTQLVPPAGLLAIAQVIG